MRTSNISTPPPPEKTRQSSLATILEWVHWADCRRAVLKRVSNEIIKKISLVQGTFDAVTRIVRSPEKISCVTSQKIKKPSFIKAAMISSEDKE